MIETRVLLVEDDDGDALLVKVALRASKTAFDLVHVGRLADAVDRLVQEAFHVVLLDLTLPDSSGLGTVRELYRVAPRVPIVVLTGLSEEVGGLDSIEAGAQDYLRKVDLVGRVGEGLLVRALRYAVERRQRQEQEVLLSEEQAARATAEEFLSIASHELYTPITSLRLAVQAMRRSAKRDEGPGAESLARRVDVLERQSKRLVKLIGELLDVSRIRAGRLELSLTSVDPVASVKHVLGDLEPELTGAGCVPTLHAGDTGAGHWDEVRIEQVITNLVSNAIKYGGAKPIAITISQRSGGSVRIEVEDHGIGIAPEDLGRIFDRFERAAPKGASGGLGLGLYIVRRIVEAHGGLVGVASVQGQGARFWVELPLAGPAAAAAR